MSRSNSKSANKHQKEYFHQFLYNANEPYDFTSADLTADYEVPLLGHTESMRQSFRQHARRIRSQ